jgi:glycosyltransferase involved in cell wall biosynthesis
LKKHRKVLIITYYWPPAGGGGVQRILKFTKYLPQLGWHPIILTVEKGDWPAIDESLMEKIPHECKVYKAKTIEPFDLYRKFLGKSKAERIPVYVLSKKKDENLKDKLARWIRANLFIPDPRIGWIPHAIKEGKKIIKKENIDFIFSSAPPPSVQLIAMNLARHAKLKWIADFRDPWTDAFWLSSLKRNFLTRSVDLRLEKTVLQKADTVTSISEGMLELFRKKVANQFQVIHNGFEKIDNRIVKSESFMILFIGHLGEYHNIDQFFKILNSLPEEVKSVVELIFVGRVFDGFNELIDKFTQLQIVFKQYMPYQDLINFSQKASLLLKPYNVNSPYARGSMGTKLYDYLALRKPIIALGKKGSISERILEETHSGKLFEYTDRDGIINFIIENFEKWKSSGYIFLESNAALEKFTTKNNVKKLVHLMEEIQYEG